MGALHGSFSSSYVSELGCICVWAVRCVAGVPEREAPPYFHSCMLPSEQPSFNWEARPWDKYDGLGDTAAVVGGLAVRQYAAPIMSLGAVLTKVASSSRRLMAS